MARLAITGHMDLTPATIQLLRAEVGALLETYAAQELVGISCLAEGADSLFADSVLEAGGRLIAVIPSRDYRARIVSSAHAPVFDRLHDRAGQVCVMPFDTAGRAAYEAANVHLLECADELVAVWDGSAPTGKGGGTADTVRAARERGIPVRVIWPPGAAREG